MKAYYQARAGEYDDWSLGRGLYAPKLQPGSAEDERGGGTILHQGPWFVLVTP